MAATWRLSFDLLSPALIVEPCSALAAQVLVDAPARLMSSLPSTISRNTCENTGGNVTSVRLPGIKAQAAVKASQTAGCENPDGCFARAELFLDALPPKWDPRGAQPEDWEVHDQKRANGEAALFGESLVPFDKRVSSHGNLTEVFRVFTSGDVCNEIPDTISEESVGNGHLTIATDGSCIDNGQVSARAGAGVFVEDGHELNREVRLPPNIAQSNQSGEVTATLIASKIAPKDIILVEETDSQTTMESLTKWRADHEDSGYALQGNAALLKATVAALRSRRARTYFKWVKGHAGHPRNEGADKLAGAGARKAVADYVDCDIDVSLRVTGCKLSRMTQSLAYRIIRKEKEGSLQARRATEMNVAKILTEIKSCFGVDISEVALWGSIRRREFSRECRQFMWMVIHDGYMVGSKWLQENMSDESQARASCKRCDVIETMEHILFDCTAYGRGTVWELLEETWELTKKSWVEPCWGNTLGAGCAVFPKGNGKRDSETEALWMTLVSESMYIIWKLRCERVIQRDGEEFSIREVENRWYATIDQRLGLERKVAAMAIKKRARLMAKVEKKWEPVLVDPDNLPSGVTMTMGVLVGIRRVRRWDPG
ncbi:hypothetical protein C8Q80DRAFT_1271475 [Daedaleopsis nitida]|nr:hypothetical protein C8Q80DRAFT_1271475 [Daedaleopsis nitida]